MRSILYRAAVFVLTLAIVLSGAVGVVPAKAATDVTFTVAVEKTAYYASERATVAIQITDATAAGFFANLKYDANVLSLVQTTVNEQVFSGMITGIKEDGLWITWSNGANKTIPAGTVVEFQFAIKSDAAAKEYIVELEVIEFLDEQMQDISCNVVDGTVNVVPLVAPAAVQEVVDLINAIGEVTTADTATDKKIKEARDAFAALPAAQKKMVTNYDVLVEANSEYQLLKEEQYAADNAAALQEICEKFRADYARVLALDPEKAQIADLAEVNEALADYAQQSAYIRKKLQPEHEKLKAVKDAIQAIIDEEDAQKAAEEMAKGFREQYARLLNTSSDSVVLSEAFKAELDAAISTYKDAFTPQAQELLKREYNHLLSMLRAYQRLEEENAPDPEWVTKAYNEFREKYRSLLLKSELDVTEEDAGLINKALGEYAAFHDRIKGKLASDYEHLMTLMFALELEDLGEELPPPVQTPPVNVSVGAKLSGTVKNLILVALIALLLAVISGISYILVRMKRRKV